MPNHQIRRNDSSASLSSISSSDSSSSSDPSASGASGAMRNHNPALPSRRPSPDGDLRGGANLRNRLSSLASAAGAFGASGRAGPAGPVLQAMSLAAPAILDLLMPLLDRVLSGGAPEQEKLHGHINKMSDEAAPPQAADRHAAIQFLDQHDALPASAGAEHVETPSTLPPQAPANALPTTPPPVPARPDGWVPRPLPQAAPASATAPAPAAAPTQAPAPANLPQATQAASPVHGRTLKKPVRAVEQALANMPGGKLVNLMTKMPGAYKAKLPPNLQAVHDAMQGRAPQAPAASQFPPAPGQSFNSQPAAPFQVPLPAALQGQQAAQAGAPYQVPLPAALQGQIPAADAPARSWQSPATRAAVDNFLRTGTSGLATPAPVEQRPSWQPPELFAAVQNFRNQAAHPQQPAVNQASAGWNAQATPEANAVAGAGQSALQKVMANEQEINRLKQEMPDSASRRMMISSLENDNQTIEADHSAQMKEQIKAANMRADLNRKGNSDGVNAVGR